MLPDINGYDVCKSLRDRRATSDIPIVMVTARLAAENRVRGFRAGAVEYLPKPYTPDQIFKAMSLADLWRRRIEGLPGEGEIAVRTSDEVAHLRATSDLHSLLLSRTRLDEDVVGLANSALLELLQRGVDWSRAHGIDLVATLQFEVGPDCVALTLHDESGWLAQDDPRNNGIAALLNRGGFDRADLPDDRDLHLTLAVPKP